MNKMIVRYTWVILNQNLKLTEHVEEECRGRLYFYLKE